MKSLHQVRAGNALKYADSGEKTRGAQGGEVVKKLPALIMNNGLLAAGAFAFAKGEGEGWFVCFDHVAKHLAHIEIGVVPKDKGQLRALLEYLSVEGDSDTLKYATEEALAWLSYAGRFVKRGPKEGGDNDTNG